MLATVLANKGPDIHDEDTSIQAHKPFFQNGSDSDNQMSNDLHLDLTSHSCENVEVVKSILQFTHAADKKKRPKKGT